MNGDNVKKIVAVAVAGLALLLTGCSQVNSAAIIGKTEIPNSTVEKTVHDILAERTKVDTRGMTLTTGIDLNTNAVRFHVISVLFDDLAKKLKIDVTPAEVAARRADIVNQVQGEKALPSALVNAGIAKKDFPRYIRTIILAEKLGQIVKAAGDTSTDGSGIQKLIVGISKEEKVKMNPRWGSWDYANGNITPASANNAVVIK